MTEFPGFDARNAVPAGTCGLGARRGHVRAGVVAPSTRSTDIEACRPRRLRNRSCSTATADRTQVDLLIWRRYPGLTREIRGPMPRMAAFVTVSPFKERSAISPSGLTAPVRLGREPPSTGSPAPRPDALHSRSERSPHVSTAPCASFAARAYDALEIIFNAKLWRRRQFGHLAPGAGND